MIKDEIIFSDYYKAKECKNQEAVVMCLHCGQCGRRFKNGTMIDDGGTTEAG